MKKSKTALPIVCLVCGIVLAGIWPAAAQRFETEKPEFYFTRLMYSSIGRGGGGLRQPEQFDCTSLSGGQGGFGGGGSWATDYPASDCKFMWGVQRLGGVRVHPQPNVIQIMDDTLFQYPIQVTRIAWA